MTDGDWLTAIFRSNDLGGQCPVIIIFFRESSSNLPLQQNFKKKHTVSISVHVS